MSEGMQLARRAVLAGSLSVVLLVALVVVGHPETQKRLELLTRGGGSTELSPAIVRDLAKLQADLANSRRSAPLRIGSGVVQPQLQQSGVQQANQQGGAGQDGDQLLRRVDDSTPLQRLDLATHDLLHKWLRIDDARDSADSTTAQNLKQKALELRNEASSLEQEATVLSRKSEKYSKGGSSFQPQAVEKSRMPAATTPEERVKRLDQMPQPLSYLESNPERRHAPEMAVVQPQGMQSEGDASPQLSQSELSLKEQYQAKAAALKHLYQKQMNLLREVNGPTNQQDAEQMAQDNGIPAVNPQLEDYTYSPTLRASYESDQQVLSTRPTAAMSQELSNRPPALVTNYQAKKLAPEHTQKLTWPRPVPSDTPRGAFKDNTIYDPDYNWPSKTEVERGDEWEEKGDCGLWGGNC